MAVRKVQPSAANAGKDSLLANLVAVVNQLQAAVVELDADATGGGVVTTTPDTLQYSTGITPT